MRYEISLCTAPAKPATNVIGPFNDLTAAHAEVAKLNRELHGQNWLHKFPRWMLTQEGEITRANDCAVQSPLNA